MRDEVEGDGHHRKVHFVGKLKAERNVDDQIVRHCDNFQLDEHIEKLMRTMLMMNLIDDYYYYLNDGDGDDEHDDGEEENCENGEMIHFQVMMMMMHHQRNMVYQELHNF